jgi:murein peptide amidase A
MQAVSNLQSHGNTRCRVVRLLVGVAANLVLMSLLCIPLSANPISEQRLLGHSVLGRPITEFQFGSGSDVILILGGMEGDEAVGSYVVDRLIANLEGSAQFADGIKAVLVPRLNPDGLARNTRTNAHGVDINRNFPTKDWGGPAAQARFYPGPSAASEPETRIVIRLIAELHPCRIITLHAPFHQLNIDGPALPLALVMQKLDHYRITTYIGYPTPGSLGTFAGKERHIPTVTLELPPVSGVIAWAQNKSALLSGINLRCR